MIYTHGLFPTRKVTGESDGFALLEAAGYVKTTSPGCIALLPFGVLVLRKIADAIRTIATEHSFSEVALPLLQKRELWEESGRATKYPGLLCETVIGTEKPYVINPTQEEAILDLFRLSAFRADDLPLRLVHIGERVRNEIRPAHGLIRSRCFTLADIYTLCRDAAEMETAAKTLEQIMLSVSKWIGLPVQQGLYYPSTLGVPTYSYWIPSVTKQCIVTRCCSCRASYRTKEPLLSCPSCGEAAFEQVSAAEVGDVMRSGDILSMAMEANVSNTKIPVHVAMAGIGVSRLLQLAAEYYSDAHGLAWPIRLAPYAVEVTTIPGRETEARKLYATLTKAGHSVLLDLRAISLGRRLVDADLFGIPVRVVLGNKTSVGCFDMKERRTGTKTVAEAKDVLYLLDQLTNNEV